MPVFSIEQDFKVKNGLIVSNTLTVLSTANSINTNTGALILAGGAAIKGSVNIFGDLSVQGNLTANISATANSATNLVGGSTGSIAYQSAPGITKFIGIGSANRILVSNGTTATWNDTLNLAGTTAASSTTTGALIVAGGVGIGGAVYIGTTSYILGSQIITTATVNLYASQTAIFAGTDTAVNTSTGNVTIWNTSTLQTITSRGNSTDQAISITNGTNSVSTNTGALIVSGGAGIGRDVRIGGILTATNLYVGPYPVSTNTSGIENPYPSIFTITNTTQASSTNTGALQVRGGVGISGNVYVGGTLNANATSADKLSTSRNITLTGDITGAVAFDGSTNVSIITTITADSVQLGVDTTGNYIGTGTVAGFGLSATGGTGEGSTFAITSNATSTDLINTVVFRDNVGNFDSKSIKVTTSTSATSTITGAFQVVGGVGIGSTLHVGGQVRLYSSDDTSNTLTGALVVSGSAAIGRNLRVGGNSLVVGAGSGGIITGLAGLTSTIITITGTTSATSTNTGALRVEGGVGIGGDLYARNIYQNGTLVGQGNLTTPTGLIFTVTNVTSATSTQTGAVQIAGGVGIGGDLYVGGGIVAQRLTISLTTITTTLVTTDDIIKTENTTNSTSTTTGALQIAGGAGIAKDLYVGANGFFVGLVTATTFIGTATSAVLATSATNVANGTVGQIPFQTAANATSFIASGSTGTVLVSRGPNSSGPVFQNTLTLSGTTAATNTQSGAFQVAGGVGIGGAVYIGTTSYIFGNEIITTASIATYSISTTTTSTFFINNSTTTTSTNSGALVVTGGVGIGGGLYVGAAVTASNIRTISGNNIFGFTGGSELRLKSTGVNPPVGVSGLLNEIQIEASGHNALAILAANNSAPIVFGFATKEYVRISTTTLTISTLSQGIVISTSTIADSTTTGALIITGGAGIGQDLYLGGDIRLIRGAYNFRAQVNTTTNSLFKVGSTTTFFEIDDVGNTFTITAQGANYEFGEDNRLTFTSGFKIFADNAQTVFEGGSPILLETLTQSTSTTTGALQVSGGIGVGGYISLASSSSATGRIRWGTVHLAVRDAGDGYGSILFNSGSASTYPTSTTSTSSVIIGALAAPNAGGDSNVVIGHQAGFNITTNRNNIFIGKNAGLSVNAGSSNVIIGGYSGNDVSQLVMISSNSNVILADGSGSIKAWADAIGQWIIPNSSNSISTITGALSVRGGVGIGGNLFVGGNLNLTNASGGTLTSTNIIVSGSTNATSTNTGAFQVVGGGGIGRDLYVGGTIYQNGFAVSTGSGGLVSPFAGIFTMTNTTNAVSSTTGALQVAGGLGIQKDIFSAGKITVGLTAGIGALTGLGTLKLESNLNAISTDTGALQVVGGAAINRDLYVGGNLLVAGGQSTATSLVAFNLAMSVAFGY